MWSVYGEMRPLFPRFFFFLFSLFPHESQEWRLGIGHLSTAITEKPIKRGKEKILKKKKKKKKKSVQIVR